MTAWYVQVPLVALSAFAGAIAGLVVWQLVIVPLRRRRSDRSGRGGE